MQSMRIERVRIADLDVGDRANITTASEGRRFVEITEIQEDGDWRRFAYENTRNHDWHRETIVERRGRETQLALI